MSIQSAEFQYEWIRRLSCVALVVSQAFYLARTGRPGPVLIDVPKDVQQQLAVPDWDVPMAISGYMARLPQQPTPMVRPRSTPTDHV